tara:strand:+ start:81 stop:800 length:720 start_codon:yes stop_codon:yes gene_type:complete
MEDLSSILKFISEIQKDEKLNTKYLYVSPNNYWTKFVRTVLNSESRDSTFLFIQNNLYKTFTVLDNWANFNKIDNKKDSDNLSPLFIKSLINDLIKSKQGIKNLQFTYQDDRIFICKLNTCLLYTDSFLHKFYNKNPEIFPDYYQKNINYDYKKIEYNENEFNDSAIKYTEIAVHGNLLKSNESGDTSLELSNEYKNNKNINNIKRDNEIEIELEEVEVEGLKFNFKEKDYTDIDSEYE